MVRAAASGPAIRRSHSHALTAPGARGRRPATAAGETGAAGVFATAGPRELSGAVRGRGRVLVMASHPLERRPTEDALRPNEENEHGDREDERVAEARGDVRSGEIVQDA